MSLLSLAILSGPWALISPPASFQRAVTFESSAAEASSTVTVGVRRDREGNLRLHGKATEQLQGSKRRRWTGSFEFGRPTGSWILFHEETGELRLRGKLVEGQRAGRWKEYDETGKQTSTMVYGSDGALNQLSTEAFESPKTGLFPVSFGKDGYGEGSTHGGLRHGLWTFRWPSGSVMMRGEYDHGAKVGPWRFWHPDGTFDHWLGSRTYLTEKSQRGWEDALPNWRPGGEPSFRPPSIRPGSMRVTVEQLQLRRKISTSVQAAVDALSPSEELALFPRTEVAFAIAIRLADVLAEEDPDVEIGLQLLDRFSQVTGEVRHWRLGLPGGLAGVSSLRLVALRLMSALWLRSEDPMLWKLETGLPNGYRPDHDLAPDFEWADQLHSCWRELDAVVPKSFMLGLQDEQAERYLGKGASVAIEKGRDWLLAHQSPDGNWDCDEFMGSDAGGANARQDRGLPQFDVGVTSLAMLALIESGVEIHGSTGSGALVNAVQWLCRQQDIETGGIGWGYESDRLVTKAVAAVLPKGGNRGRRPGGAPGRPDLPDIDVCTHCKGSGLQERNGQQYRCTICGGDGEVDRSTAPTEPGAPRHKALGVQETDLYQHSLATLALARVYEHYPSLPLRRATIKAVNFLTRARNPYGAWRYSIPPDGDSDVNTSGVASMALHVAERAGIPTDSEASTQMMAFLDEMTDEGTGRIGYTSRGSVSARVAGFNLETFPVSGTEAMTALGLHVRILLGQNQTRPPSAILRDHAELLLRKLPAAGFRKGSVDRYYWLFGSAAMSDMGGNYGKAWKKALVPAAVETQRQDGGADYRGSWDPNGPWGFAGGRVYSTAVSMLCLLQSSGTGSIFHPARQR